jgi:ubiquinone/menaquinone biosynthesis C-methylase UbiE
MALCEVVGTVLAAGSAGVWVSTRVESLEQHVRTGSARYPYRAKSAYVLAELDLRPGDVVVDIGAGDGWWSEKMAEDVGTNGLVYASEVEQRKVRQMVQRFGGTSRVKPYLSPTDSTGLAENTCDLAFFSQTFHHLDKTTRVDYLRHLREVVKPAGRLCVIEKYTDIASRHGAHGTSLSQLVLEAEQAGWIPVRCELMTGTYHYLAIFVQRDLFPPEP